MSLKIIPAENDEINCPVSLEPYINPVILVNCGHTFSESYAIQLRRCAICNTSITNPPIPNYALREIMSTKGEVLPVSEVYELFCIDISSSMWYSDYFGPLSLIAGMSRIEIAKRFCIEMSIERERDPSHKMGLIVFGSNVTQKVNFGTPRAFRDALVTLKPIENRTRIFDAFEEAVQHLSTKNNCEVRLYMMTDGGENFSSEQNTGRFKDRLKSVVDATQRLKIVPFIFNVGGDIDNVRKTAEAFHGEVKHIDSKNFSSLASDICKVSFPNREQQILNIFKKVPTIPAESVMVKNNSNNNNNLGIRESPTPQRVAINV